ncbi:photosystem II protein Psb27 [Stenomitos frigidus]|uniref:Photosystem II lipoprotein Psb27 n=1 Tax=Stenomitos frigidus ULC18 TaxID=2107698 RepID=A0A2T1DTS4_9CYAN|nr:photosystem II protein Psb27 [Stenomitos frigidus]PSB23831.1 photosystem II protein Psb27 [Stenomitos frigidus ULC18]
MKRYLSSFFSLVLVVLIGLMGFAPAARAATALSGDYRQDTAAVVDALRTSIQLPDDAPDRSALQTEARQLINDFTARYRRNGSVAKLTSYTTMRTALNSLAGHYSSYPNRPVPQKLRDRLEQEFKQIELSLSRGS